jgi:tRNA(Glu) U13 pseudouridine synthase TruD
LPPGTYATSVLREFLQLKNIQHSQQHQQQQNL